MGYADWGDNAHWFYGFDPAPSTSYEWSVTVSNLCGTSQTVSGTVTTDCDANPFRSLATDECGVCGGDDSTCLDCCGVPNGSGDSCDSACGPCSDDVLGHVRVATTPAARIAVAPNSSGDSCDGVYGPCGDETTCLDACGVPNGDDSSCADCCGVPYGSGDSCDGACGPCGDDTTSWTRAVSRTATTARIAVAYRTAPATAATVCAVRAATTRRAWTRAVSRTATTPAARIAAACRTAPATAAIVCGPCGDDTTCLDACGVPSSDDSSCADCCGVPNGSGDSCDGVCGPCDDATSCLDECGVPDGPGIAPGACNCEGDVPDEGHNCAGDCIATDVTWAGDQNSDGFIGFDVETGTAYVNVESYPNVGSAVLTLNDATYDMGYGDWGDNAHWFYGFEPAPSTSYEWSVTVSNLCGTSRPCRARSAASALVTCGAALRRTNVACVAVTTRPVWTAAAYRTALTTPATAPVVRAATTRRAWTRAVSRTATTRRVWTAAACRTAPATAATVCAVRAVTTRAAWMPAAYRVAMTPAARIAAALPNGAGDSCDGACGPCGDETTCLDVRCPER